MILGQSWWAHTSPERRNSLRFPKATFFCWYVWWLQSAIISPHFCNRVGFSWGKPWWNSIVKPTSWSSLLSPGYQRDDSGESYRLPTIGGARSEGSFSSEQLFYRKKHWALMKQKMGRETYGEFWYTLISWLTFVWVCGVVELIYPKMAEDLKHLKHFACPNESLPWQSPCASWPRLPRASHRAWFRRLRPRSSHRKLPRHPKRPWVHLDSAHLRPMVWTSSPKKRSKFQLAHILRELGLEMPLACWVVDCNILQPSLVPSPISPQQLGQPEMLCGLDWRAWMDGVLWPVKQVQRFPCCLDIGPRWVLWHKDWRWWMRNPVHMQLVKSFWNRGREGQAGPWSISWFEKNWEPCTAWRFLSEQSQPQCFFSKFILVSLYRSSIPMRCLGLRLEVCRATSSWCQSANSNCLKPVWGSKQIRPFGRFLGTFFREQFQMTPKNRVVFGCVLDVFGLFSEHFGTNIH